MSELSYSISDNGTQAHMTASGLSNHLMAQSYNNPNLLMSKKTPAPGYVQSQAFSTTGPPANAISGSKQVDDCLNEFLGDVVGERNKQDMQALNEF